MTTSVLEAEAAPAAGVGGSAAAAGTGKPVSPRNGTHNSLGVPYDVLVADTVTRHQYNFVISDPRLTDHPIVFASEGFCMMTGYSADEVIGNNCRFLQGPDTDRRTVLEIRDAIREERPCQVRILNYSKEGKAFWNLFHLAPVYSRDDGRVIHFVGVQTPVAEADEALCSSTGGVSQTAAPTPGDQGSSRSDVPCAITDCKAGSPCRPLVDTAASDIAQAVQKDLARNSSGELRELWSQESIAKRLRDEGMDNADIMVTDEDRSKAKAAVAAVLKELQQASKGAVSQERCMELAQSAQAGVVCSSLLCSLSRVQQSFVLADPHLPDMPIVHVSDVFLELTGYPREEVVGRNCRFLQGPETDQETVKQIREAIAAEKAYSARLLNYRKDGTPFWNSLHVSPVRNAEGRVAFFVGVQLDITAAEGVAVTPRVSNMTVRMKQLGCVGAVRVAVRGLQGAGLRRSES